MFLTVFGKPRYLGLVSESETPVLVPGEPVVVQTSRGEEVAKVAGEISGEQADFYVRSNEEGAKDGVQNGEPGLQTVIFIRQANEEDIVLDEENRVLEENVLLGSRRLLGEHGLAHEDRGCGIPPGQKKALFLFYIGAEGGFQGLRKGSSEGVQDQNRAASDRSEGRGQGSQGYSPMWSPMLL